MRDVGDVTPEAHAATEVLSGATEPQATAGGSSLPVGDGHYRVTGEVGRGGLGRVCSARDLRLARTVAVKELLRPGQADAERRFLREALVIARLQHPAIIPIYEASRWLDGRPFYSMKLVSGRSLQELVAEARGFAGRLALVPHVATVADAIAYAHGQRVVHRDLKPANVLVGEFGETVVIDWGVAKELDAADGEGDAGGGGDDAALTAIGSVIGTPQFMPPEQAAGRPVDERVDVYALGAILYSVLAGAPPYDGPGASAVLAAVQHGPPRPLVEREPAVPADLAAIVAKAMARDAAARYPTAKELADDLRRYLTGQLVRVHEYSAGALLLRWIGRHRGAVGVGLVSLAALVVLGVVSLRSVVRERDRAGEARRRADGERARAETERERADSRTRAMTLIEARSSLAVNPTAALAWLKTYPSGGPDQAAVQGLAAEAVERVVARHVIVGPVATTAFSPDGKLLAAGSRYGKAVAVYDVASGATILKTELPGNSMELRFGPDSETLAIVDRQGNLVVQGVRSGRRTVTPGHATGSSTAQFVDGGATIAVQAAADGGVDLVPVAGGPARTLRSSAGRLDWLVASPDGRKVAGAGDRDVALWDVAGGEARIIPGRVRPRHLAFAPDGGSLAVGYDDGTVAVVALPGLARRELRGHSGAVNYVAFSEGGALASVGNDGTARVWDLATGRAQVHDGGGDALESVAFFGGGRGLAMCGDGGDARLWDLDSDETRVLRGTTCYFVRSTPAGDLLAMQAGRHLSVWEVRLPHRRTMRLDEPAMMMTLPSGGAPLVLTGHHTVILVDVATGARRRLAGHGEEIWTTSVSADGSLAASTDLDHVTWLWDTRAATGRRLAELGDCQVTELDPAGRTLACGGEDGAIRLYDVGSRAVRRLAGHQGAVSWLSFSRDGAGLVSAGHDGTARLWDLARGEARVFRDASQHVLFGARPSADGRWIAAHGDGGTVVWEVAGGAARLLDKARATWIEWSPGPAALLAVAGRDGPVQLHDVAGGGAARLLRGDPRGVSSVSFSSDGTYLAGCGRDGGVWIWRAATADAQVVQKYDGWARGARFVDGDRRVASIGIDQTIRFADFDPTAFVPADPQALRAWLARATTATIESFGFSADLAR